VEGESKGKWQGRTRTNKLVFFRHEDCWRGKLVWVKIEKSSPWSLQGKLIAEVGLAA
jgi:tRNA-2-methylthio-N6-dimethylallyladenosine synthase